MASVAQAPASPSRATTSGASSPTPHSATGAASGGGATSASSATGNGSSNSPRAPPTTAGVPQPPPRSPLMSAGSRDRDIAGLIYPADRCSYAPCFCEENVWKLCDHVRSRSPASELSKCYAVFVSNKKQVVPLWRQKAGKDEEKLVIWDYHVIFIYKPDERCLVFDLDSDLPFPTHFGKYVTETFRTDAILNPEYHRFFRVVPAPVFLSKFSSDRRHMKKPDGSWMKSPPNYPCIQTSETPHNLDEFISMDQQQQQQLGEVMTLQEFVKRFHRRN